MQLKYCQKLDFEADPINKLKPLIKKTKIFTDPNNKHPGVNYFFFRGRNPQMVALFLICFLRGIN